MQFHYVLTKIELNCATRQGLQLHYLANLVISMESIFSCSSKAKSNITSFFFFVKAHKDDSGCFFGTFLISITTAGRLPSALVLLGFFSRFSLSSKQEMLTVEAFSASFTE